DLVSTYWEWENDPGAILGYGRQVPDSLESRTEGYGHQVRNALNQLRFTVYDIDDEKPTPAGLSTLLIDHQVRTAEFLILLGPQARGRGLATEATLLTLDYGFHVAALRMIWLKVLEPNAAAIRAYPGAGFQHAGRLRQAGYWLGEPCDEIIMDALREDFPGPSRIRSHRCGYANP
ncbi:MAG: GNAT family N-acetyltransferase, partial [Terriglobales bacterium]